MSTFTLRNIPKAASHSQPQRQAEVLKSTDTSTKDVETVIDRELDDLLNESLSHSGITSDSDSVSEYCCRLMLFS